MLGSWTSPGREWFEMFVLFFSSSNLPKCSIYLDPCTIVPTVDVLRLSLEPQSRLSRKSSQTGSQSQQTKTLRPMKREKPGNSICKRPCRWVQNWSYFDTFLYFWNKFLAQIPWKGHFKSGKSSVLQARSKSFVRRGFRRKVPVFLSSTKLSEVVKDIAFDALHHTSTFFSWSLVCSLDVYSTAGESCF
jgi:hypothetical protein